MKTTQAAQASILSISICLLLLIAVGCPNTVEPTMMATMAETPPYIPQDGPLDPTVVSEIFPGPFFLPVQAPESGSLVQADDSNLGKYLINFDDLTVSDSDSEPDIGPAGNRYFKNAGVWFSRSVVYNLTTGSKGWHIDAAVKSAESGEQILLQGHVGEEVVYWDEIPQVISFNGHQNKVSMHVGCDSGLGPREILVQAFDTESSTVEPVATTRDSMTCPHPVNKLVILESSAPFDRLKMWVIPENPLRLGHASGPILLDSLYFDNLAPPSRESNPPVITIIRP